MSHGRSSVEIIKRRCIQLKLDCSHFKKNGNGKLPQYELDEILIENSQYKNNSRLVIRLINENKLKYKNSVCGNKGIWNDKPLTL